MNSRFSRWLFTLLAACLISGVSYGQITVTGTVTDAETGEALPGATALEQGTTNGTVTNGQGTYILEVAGSSSVIVFSFVGYESVSIPVGNQTTIDMALEKSTSKLDEVVVIGYGSTMRKNITGAVSSVKAESISNLPVAGFDEAIQGKMAGVRVINSNAAPGGGFDIQIRGVGTITSSGFPLIVVDGMPLPDEEYKAEQNPFNMINPNDIESLEVLKDASSAAIYGARASNGVILITTKKGTRGKANIDFSASYGFTQYINEPQMGNADQYMDWRDAMSYHAYDKSDPGNYNPGVEASWNWDDDQTTRNANLTDAGLVNGNADRMWDFYGFDPTISPEKQAQFLSWMDRSAYLFDDETDWLNTVTRDSDYPGRKQSYSLSASGGTDRARYYISGSYYKDLGIIRETDYARYTANINVDFKVTDWATVGAKVMPSWQDLNNIGGSRVETRWYSDPLYQATLKIPPILPVYDEDGMPAIYGRGSEWNQIYNNWGTEFFGNPILTFEMTDNRKTFRNLSNFFVEFQILKSLKFRTSLLSDYESGSSLEWHPSTYGNRFQNPGPANFAANNVWSGSNTSTRNKIYWENLLTFNHTFGENHNLNAILGYTLENTRFNSGYMRKAGYVSDEVPTANAGSVVVDQPSHAVTNANRNAFIGMFARAAYNYSSKYYLTAAVRRDGSSRFGSESLWGTFPSVSVAWRITGENFMESVGWLDDLKLRASYGITGNSGIPNYKQQRIISYDSYIINNASVTGFRDAALFDPALSWERSQEFNIGLDASFLTNGRIVFTTDVYQKTTTDMLLSVAMPDYSGYGSILQNFGEMRNTGIEAALNVVPFVGEFFWESSFNIAHNRNEILSLFDNPKVPIGGQSVAGIGDVTRGYVGGPISVYWGTVYDGIYNDWDEVYNNPRSWNYSGNNLDNMRRVSNAPGEARYMDVNGDGKIDGNDATVIGNPWPDFFFGWSNTFRYKGFDLYLHLEGTSGVEVFNMVKYEWYRQAQRGFNMPEAYLEDFWTPDNTDAEYPIISARTNVNSGAIKGTQILEDGDYVALRSCRLGYTLPSRVSQKIHLRKIRIYANIYNALYFTKYEGFNPEGNNRGSDSIEKSRNFGVDGGNYPLSRTVTFGIDIGI